MKSLQLRNVEQNGMGTISTNTKLFSFRLRQFLSAQAIHNLKAPSGAICIFQ